MQREGYFGKSDIFLGNVIFLGKNMTFLRQKLNYAVKKFLFLRNKEETLLLRVFHLNLCKIYYI